MYSKAAEELETSGVATPSKSAILRENIALLMVKESQMLDIAEFMHDHQQMYGWFNLHHSFEEGQQFVSNLTLGNQTVFIAPKINNEEVACNLLEAIDERQMENFITSLVDEFPNRFYKSTYGVEASDWITNYWKEIASPRKDIKVESIPQKHSNQNS